MGAIDFIAGKWKSDKSKDVNVVPFMVASGVPQAVADKMSQGETTIEITESGSQIALVVANSGQNTETRNFELGKEFDFATPEGLSLAATITAEGNKLVENYTAKDSGVKFTTVREVSGSEMKAVTTSPAGSMTQIFVKA